MLIGENSLVGRRLRDGRLIVGVYVRPAGGSDAGVRLIVETDDNRLERVDAFRRPPASTHGRSDDIGTQLQPLEDRSADWLTPRPEPFSKEELQFAHPQQRCGYIAKTTGGDRQCEVDAIDGGHYCGFHSLPVALFPPPPPPPHGQQGVSARTGSTPPPLPLGDRPPGHPKGSDFTEVVQPDPPHPVIASNPRYGESHTTEPPTEGVT